MELKIKIIVRIYVSRDRWVAGLKILNLRQLQLNKLQFKHCLSSEIYIEKSCMVISYLWW